MSGKVVCERWCVTKKDGVCDKVVCERGCVKDGVSKMMGDNVVWKVCDEAVCKRWCG